MPVATCSDEEHRGSAAEDIKPACVVGGRGVRGCFVERLDETEAALQPLICFDAAFFQTHEADLVAWLAGAI